MRGVLVILGALLLVCSQAKMVIGYYPAWGTYGRNYQVTDIRAEYLTHIFYAFANIANGECVLGDSYADIEKMFPGDTWDQPLKGNFNQLIKLKQQYPGLKNLISIGGWTWSKYFSDVALTEASRQKFVTSCVNFMLKYSFDGIDVDWEYPVEGGLEDNIYRPEDGVNHALLMQKFREELDKLGTHYPLTIAAPAGPKIYAHLQFPALANSLDWINLMTYDFRGGWSNWTGHQAALYFNSSDPALGDGFYGDFAMSEYVRLGFPAAKLLLGAAFYGRGFKEVPSNGAGLFQTFNGVPYGSWDNTGVFDYDDIKNNLIGGGSYGAYYDSAAKAAWVYSPTTGIMVSYDSAQVMKDRTDYVKQKGYAGVFFWELSGDRQAELLKILYDNLP